LDATATVLLGTIGVGFGGLAWRMFSQLDSLQDPRNAGSFEKRLDELFADFQVLSMTPRIWSVFQRALQFPLQNQSEFFAQPEAQLEFNRIRARLEQLVLVNRSAHSAMESLSSAGAISAAGAVFFLIAALIGFEYFSSDLLLIATTVFAASALGVGFFYGRFRVRKGSFLEKERNFRSLLGG